MNISPSFQEQKKREKNSSLKETVTASGVLCYCGDYPNTCEEVISDHRYAHISCYPVQMLFDINTCSTARKYGN